MSKPRRFPPPWTIEEFENGLGKCEFHQPYYIAPNGKTGAEAFVVIRDAMQDEERVALAPAWQRPAGHDAAL